MNSQMTYCSCIFKMVTELFAHKFSTSIAAEDLDRSVSLNLRPYFVLAVCLIRLGFMTCEVYFLFSTPQVLIELIILLSSK